MAKTLEELILFKNSALRYLLARESRLLALGKKPVNKKIANFVRKHNNDSWTSFMDSFSEDWTKNVNVFAYKITEEHKCNEPRRYRIDSTSREFLREYKIGIR